MEINTTVEQRKAWAEVHKALTNYIVNFGQIEVQREDEDSKIVLFLDDFISYPQVGLIYCPDYLHGYNPDRKQKKGLDKIKTWWYNKFRK